MKQWALFDWIRPPGSCGGRRWFTLTMKHFETVLKFVSADCSLNAVHCVQGDWSKCWTENWRKLTGCGVSWRFSSRLWLPGSGLGDEQPPRRRQSVASRCGCLFPQLDDPPTSHWLIKTTFDKNEYSRLLRHQFTRTMKRLLMRYP